VLKATSVHLVLSDIENGKIVLKPISTMLYGVKGEKKYFLNDNVYLYISSYYPH